MKNSVRIISFLLVFLICCLTIGFSAFSADMIVNDMIAYIRPQNDVRVTRVVLDDSNSSGYTLGDYDYDVSNITGSFQLDSIGSKITYAVDVTVYGNTKMAVKNISVGENGSGLSVTVTGYDLKTKLCDNNNSSKCSLNATKTMYVTVERTSGSTVNYNNVRLDFDFQQVYDISYSNMNNTGYPNTILDGDDMTITFANDSTKNGTATYTYNTDTLVVNSYTATMPSNFTITGNSTNSYSNNVLTINNVTADITITKENASTTNSAQTILSLVDGYSSSSTNIINLGTGAGGCTKTLAYDGTADNNLRYIGADPCNYVSFNKKTWRIIGIFNNIEVPNKSESETLIKLILNENYGSDTLWNTTASNIWGNSSLYSTLNNTYYTSNLNSSPYVENVNWSLGAASGAAFSAQSFYVAEHGSTPASNANTKYSGYVGIMHVSDYGFATSGDMNNSTREDCLMADLNSTRKWTSSCYDYDWLLFTDKIWTINPSTSGTNYAFRISYNQLTATTVNGTYNKAAIRPVIFLKSNVMITSGDGTSGNPYQLMQ